MAQPVAVAKPIQNIGLYQKPHVTLVAVTDWQAVLKPCGCTVDLQKGGVERIGKFVADLRTSDNSVVVVHAGNLLADDEPLSSTRAQQAELRMRAFVAALDRIQIAAVSLSSLDLQQGGPVAKKILESVHWPLLSLDSTGGVNTAVPSAVIKTASGVQVGLIGIDPASVGDDAARQLRLQTLVGEVKSKGAQVVVVLSNLGLRPSRKLARSTTGIDVMVIGHLDAKADPEGDLEREGNTLVVHATRQGAYFAALTLVPSADGQWKEASEFLPGAVGDLQVRIAALEKNLTQWRQKKAVATQRALPYLEQELAEMKKRLLAAQAAASQPLPSGALALYRTVGLAWNAAVDPEIAQLVKHYDDEVAEINMKNAGDVPKPADGQPHYVGQAVCAGCHQKTKDFVANDLHQHAWATLENVGKTKDLDCVACHSTGFGKPGGSNLAKLKGFTNVQCEACHGPGSQHADSPRKGMNSRIIAAPNAPICATCHTPEHAPRFAFEEYRKRIVVPGHGLPLPGGPKL